MDPGGRGLEHDSLVVTSQLYSSLFVYWVFVLLSFNYFLWIYLNIKIYIYMHTYIYNISAEKHSSNSSFFFYCSYLLCHQIYSMARKWWCMIVACSHIDPALPRCSSAGHLISVKDFLPFAPSRPAAACAREGSITIHHMNSEQSYTSWENTAIHNINGKDEDVRLFNINGCRYLVLCWCFLYFSLAGSAGAKAELFYRLVRF